MPARRHMHNPDEFLSTPQASHNRRLRHGLLTADGKGLEGMLTLLIDGRKLQAARRRTEHS